MTARQNVRRLPRLDLRVGPLLRRAVSAYAERSGLSASAACRYLIEHALTVLDDSDEPVASRLDQIAAVLTRIEVLLEIVGPVALGLPSLIAYCAGRGDTVAVSEDELLDEFWRNASQLWEAELEAVASALAREQL